MADQTQQQDAPPPLPQAAVGAEGTAKVSFTDALGADVPVSATSWASSDNVKVEPDETDPASAKVTAIAPGRANVTVTAETAGGPTTAAAEVLIIETGKPASGKLEVTLSPPAKK